MLPISNETIRSQNERIKNAFATPEATLRTIEEGMAPEKAAEEKVRLVNNPNEALVISESLVTKGSIMEKLNEKDDLSIKNLVEADKNGETSTVPTRDFLNEIADQPLKIDA